nr:ribonuclease H-like domain-containing protein [Tanacetum cinerariifolium]
MLNVHLLIANIESLKDNPTPSSKLLTKSSSTSPKSFLEETNTFHNSLPEFENFYFDLGEISSGSTTTHYDISLLDYESFYFNNDHIKEISSGSTTTHSDISLFEYDSFIFDFANEEFIDKLAHIISPPEYDHFYFWDFPDPGELMYVLNSGIRKNLSSTTRANLPVKDDHSPLLAYVVVQIILCYMDSGCSKHMIGNRSQLMNFVSNFFRTVRFRNDQIAKIIGDAEIAKQLQEAIADADSAHDIDWNDPAVLRYHVLRNRSFSVAEEVMKKSRIDLQQKQFAKEVSKKKDDSSSKPVRGSRKKTIAKKRIGAKLDEESAKRQKLKDVTEEEATIEYEKEKEELRLSLKIIHNGDSKVNYEPLSKKFPIMSWEYQLLEKMEAKDMEFSSRKVQDHPLKGHDLLLLGDLRMIFNLDENDELWMNQLDWKLLRWKLHENCGVHTLFMDGALMEINILVEKKYHLIKELLENMLILYLEAEEESTMACLGSISGIRASVLRNFNLKVMEFKSAQNNTTAKLPILKLGEYELWVIRIKQYFQVQDYALWEVIENGNSWVFVLQTTQDNGVLVTKMSVPEIAEEKINKKNDVKARSLLQKIVSRLEILDVVITQKYLNSKFLRSLPPEWNTHVVVWMNKADIETMSIDDLYNNFKVVEQDVNDNVMYAFMVENANGSNLLQKDLEQIHEDDLEAMDLRWQLSLLTTYKRGLATVEEQLVTYKKNQVLFSEEVAVYKREVACKEYEINVLKRYHAVPPPHPIIYNVPRKLDFSYSGLDEFKEPEFKGYGPTDSKLESNINHDKKSDDSKENSDDSFVKEQASEDTSIFVESPLMLTKKLLFLLIKR